MSAALLLCIVLAVAIGDVVAHNFVACPSRAVFASTKKPMLQRRHTYPHAALGMFLLRFVQSDSARVERANMWRYDVALGRGDEMQVEWMTGHSVTPTYFTLVRAEDAHLLEGVTREMLDEYIAGAPEGADSMPPRRFRKFHRKNGVQTYESDILDNHHKDNQGNVSPLPNFFKAVVDESDPAFLARPAHYGAQGVLLEFKDSEMKNDRYVAYKSEKYPWMVSVARYGLEALQAGRADAARVVVPDYAFDEMSGGQQEFVLNYWWRAYWDALDIQAFADDGIMMQSNNQTEIEARIYGVPSSEQYMTRIDHCNFPDFQRIATDCYEVVTTPEICFERCNSEYGCLGVLIAPIKLPDTVYSGFSGDGGIPWGEMSAGRGDKNYTCFKEDFAHIKDDETKFVCVGIIPRTPTQTFDIYEETNDPTNPDFYSSCYVKTSYRQFEFLPPPPAVESLDWRPARREFCVPCDELARYENLTTTTVYKGRAKTSYNHVFPEWNVTTENCVRCDLEPGTAIPDHWQYNQTERIAESDWITEIVDGSKCDGIDRDSQSVVFKFGDMANADTCEEPRDCWKRVHTTGVDFAAGDRRSPDPYECAYATKHDDECSGDAVIVKTYYAQCHCRRKNVSCCKNCAIVSDSTRDVLRIKVKK